MRERTDSYWEFSLDVYGRPDVAPACLELQDRLGLDVNVLLMALFAAHILGRALTPNEIEQADRSIAAWRQQVVEPLRNVRILLKKGPFPAPDADTIRLRNTLKTVEQDAERIEQRSLAAWIESLPSRDCDPIQDSRALTAAAVVDFYADNVNHSGDRTRLLQLAATIARASAA